VSQVFPTKMVGREANYRWGSRSSRLRRILRGANWLRETKSKVFINLCDSN